jgi:ribose transport system permease protein
VPTAERSLLPEIAKAYILAKLLMVTATVFRRFRHAFEDGSSWKSTVAMLAVFVGAAFASPRSMDGHNIFLDAANLTDALRALVPVAVIALAMTFVILTGGIDLSVGAVVALSGVVTARLLMDWKPVLAPSLHLGAAILAGLGAGLLAGCLNGVLISWLRIQPFIVTLASMIGLRGLALWVSNNERIGLGVGRDVGGLFGEWFSSKALMVGTWMVLALVFAILLNRMVFGRHLRALGDNPTAALLAGLPVARIQIAAYALSGVLAGVAGILLAARTTTGDPNAGVAMELDAIAVVVIGGASLSGGRGGIYGTLCGALIIGMVTNVLGLRNVGSNAQLVLKAVIIVLSVAAQRNRPRS